MRRMMDFTLDAGMTQGALRQCAICAWGYIGGVRAHKAKLLDLIERHSGTLQ